MGVERLDMQTRLEKIRANMEAVEKKFDDKTPPGVRVYNDNIRFLLSLLDAQRKVVEEMQIAEVDLGVCQFEGRQEAMHYGFGRGEEQMRQDILAAFARLEESPELLTPRSP